VQKGQLAQGIALLRRSVKLDPGAAELHHDLGAVLFAARRLDEAAQAFRVALSLNPCLPTAHQHLAQILEGLGHEEAALGSYQAAVALAPDLSTCHFRLAQIYFRRGQNQEAAAAFRAAAAAAPGTPTGLIAEARALEALDDLDGALAAMRAAIETYPAHGMARVVLGDLLSQLGLTVEAARHYERATELEPRISAAWAGLAINRKFTREDGPLIARMNAALTRPPLTPRQRQSIHLALGKAHEDLGNYEIAMRNFEAGARARTLGGGLDRATLIQRIDRLIEATPPGYRDLQPDRGAEDATPILIVGMPRSGSTLIEQVLSAHPEIAAGGELTFWSERDMPGGDVWRVVSTPEATRRLADDYLAKLRTFGPDAKRVTDKMLENFLRLGLIHRVLPNATIVHCRRHPVDTALSIFATDLMTNLSYAGTRSDLVFYFKQYRRLMAHWREALPPDRLIEMDYEALVQDPEPHARRLIAACGLEWSEACLAPHRNMRRVNTASVSQVRQPIYRTSLERWRRYERWLGELRELFAEV
jgi:tetratricopeptide (TPR) repeat protein